MSNAERRREKGESGRFVRILLRWRRLRWF